MKRIVLENLRSAYNVGNIVRTADALGWWVVRVGYTARSDHKQVVKTSLWSEQSIPKMEFEQISDFFSFITINKTKEPTLSIAAEISEKSIPLTDLHIQFASLWEEYQGEVFVIVWNEVTWVEQETLEKSDTVVHIPMQGIKESLNVGQAAAIIMRELWKYHHI